MGKSSATLQTLGGDYSEGACGGTVVTLVDASNRGGVYSATRGGDYSAGAYGDAHGCGRGAGVKRRKFDGDWLLEQRINVTIDRAADRDAQPWWGIGVWQRSWKSKAD